MLHADTNLSPACHRAAKDASSRILSELGPEVAQKTTSGEHSICKIEHACRRVIQKSKRGQQGHLLSSLGKADDLSCLVDPHEVFYDD
jgi:hypothetical protein